MARILGCLTALVISVSAWCASLPGVSESEASSGLKQALMDGSAAAVRQLGAENGFFADPKVKIPLPPALQRVESALRFAGMRNQAEELVLAMNRAAEAAVPEAKALLVESVKRMTVRDAHGILTGGETAATEYFRRTTHDQLAKRFLPIVKKQTDRAGLAEQYNALAGHGLQLGLVKKDQATIEGYVTEKALDGLYFMIAEQEKSFRKNPLGATSEIVKRVFGSVR